MHPPASTCLCLCLNYLEFVPDCTWLFLAVLGCTWLYLTLLGCTWLFLAALGYGHGLPWSVSDHYMKSGWMDGTLNASANKTKYTLNRNFFFDFFTFLYASLHIKAAGLSNVLDRKKSAFSILLLINSNCSHVGHTSQKSNMSQDANTSWRKMTFDKSQCVNLSHLHIVRAKNIATFGFME